MAVYYHLSEAVTMRNTVFLAAAAAIALSNIGCGDSSSADLTVPSFTKGQGQAGNGANAYPGAPYGINPGSVAENYQFLGYVNSVTSQATLQPVELANFYNPHADDPTYMPKTPAEDDRLFPPGSPFGAGTPKPKALLIDVSSVWCPPCNEEAATNLPAKYAYYKPLGGEFLLNLADGPDVGTAATTYDLTKWTSMYGENFPAVIDPEYKLAALFAADFFPANMIVNPRNMKICQVMSGAPSAGAWNNYYGVLTNKSPDPVDPLKCLD
jgi:hypothetical protein